MIFVTNFELQFNFDLNLCYYFFVDFFCCFPCCHVINYVCKTPVIASCTPCWIKVLVLDKI